MGLSACPCLWQLGSVQVLRTCHQPVGSEGLYTAGPVLGNGSLGEQHGDMLCCGIYATPSQHSDPEISSPVESVVESIPWHGLLCWFEKDSPECHPDAYWKQQKSNRRARRSTVLKLVRGAAVGPARCCPVLSRVGSRDVLDVGAC